MDISNLIIQLQAKVNNLTYNQLAVAKSIELLKTGQVNYATSISELPSATASNGKMYYVRSLGIYYSNGTSWLALAGESIIENTTWAWGCNAVGQLGDNTAVSTSSPVLVVGGFCDWLQVSAGGCHSLAVTTNGSAWAWGGNGFGQLGTDNTTSRSSPVSIIGGFTDWCQISAGYGHSLAIRQNGTAWAWGNNCCGILGDNTVINKSSPVSVVGGFTDWCQVSAGSAGFYAAKQAHSLAVRQNGTAWAWGCSDRGQLGDNTSVSKSSPVSVVGGFVNWCQISAGNGFSLGLRQTGILYAWGCNGSGQLGDNTVTTRSSPVSVVGGFTNWCQISAGDAHSLAVRTNGSAWAWGLGTCGRLGDNTVVSKRSPISVVGGFTEWCQLSAGGCHSLGVGINGTAWAWGEGAQGRLGDNSGNTDRSSPVSIFFPDNTWYQVSAGFAHSLAIRTIDAS
jgi:alpha-tubulin suppressor-like RCC1 family protein